MLLVKPMLLGVAIFDDGRLGLVGRLLDDSDGIEVLEGWDDYRLKQISVRWWSKLRGGDGGGRRLGVNF